MKSRVRLTNDEAIFLGLELKPNETGRNQARYYLDDTQLKNLEYYRLQPKERRFVETQVKKDRNGNVISSLEKFQSEPIDIPENFEIAKISTSKTTGQQWIQYKPKEQEPLVNEIDFEKILKKLVVKSVIKPKKLKTSFLFDRVVYTDAHIGMTTNKNGHSLYGGKWDEDEIFNRLETLVSHTLENQKSNTLIIDELGDFMDGWNGQTVRKGHDLPQNMDNEKAFDIGLEFKVRLIDALAPYYSKIICNNICNDNHSGSFGYTVNKAAKKYIELKYKHVKVYNHRKFIVHYTFENLCFILTHGKDDKHLKFGFKPFLDSKQIEKIENYINHHNLHNYLIEFSKGDSHQKIFDETTSDKFNYYNYGAFSPSSEWVQTNFKKGKSFFEFFNYKKTGNKVHNPFVFEWKVNREETTLNLTA